MSGDQAFGSAVVFVIFLVIFGVIGLVFNPWPDNYRPLIGAVFGAIVTVAFLAIVESRLLAKAEKLRSQEKEAILQREQAERVTLERQRISSLPSTADAKLHEAHGDAETALQYFNKADLALRDNRAAAFYESLSGTLNYIRYAKSEICDVPAILRMYETDRGSYGLPPHLLRKEDTNPLLEWVLILEQRAAGLFLAAERMPPFVTIRLQMEGNKEAEQYYKKALAQGEKILKAQCWTALQTAELTEVVDLGFSRLAHTVKASGDANLAAINAATESADVSADKAHETAKAMQDALHDIHRRTVKPSLTNRYKG